MSVPIVRSKFVSSRYVKPLVVVVSGFVVALVVVLETFSMHSLQAATTSVPFVDLMAKHAPPFATTTNIGRFDLSKTDKPVVLIAFATWCEACQDDVRWLNQLYSEYGHKVDFIAVSGSPVANNGGAATVRDLREFVRVFGPRYPVAFDASYQVAQQYLRGAFPTIVLINRRKVIVQQEVGMQSRQQLETQLQSLISPTSPP